MGKYILPTIISAIFVILLISLNPDSRLNLVEDRKNNPSIISTPTSVPRQTYRNDKYGFEFQYPSQLVISSDNNRILFDNSPTDGQIPFTILIFNSFTTKDRVTQLKKTYSLIEEKIEFNGIEFVKVGYTSEIGNVTEYLLESKKDLLIFSSNTDILSTFTLLQDISLWKTYKSEAYGFEFKYPSNYVVKEMYGVTIYNPSLQSGTNFIQIRQVKSLKEVCDRKCTQESPLIIGQNSFIPFNSGLSGKSFYTKNIVVTSLASGIDETDKIFSTLLSSLIVSNTSTTFCGGIAGIKCSSDQTCQLDGNYPDAGGVCVN